MSDRDYLMMFPSWFHFILFNLILFMGLYCLGIVPAAFINHFPIGKLFMLLTTLGLMYATITYFVFSGSAKARNILVVFHGIFSILAILKTYFYQDDLPFWMSLSAVIISLLVCVLMLSPWYSSFISYRSRHLSVVRKIRKGERLDDGSYFQND